MVGGKTKVPPSGQSVAQYNNIENSIKKVHDSGSQQIKIGGGGGGGYLS